MFYAPNRLRARIFKEKLHWDVHVNQAGLEVDEFDLPEAVYLLSLDKNRRVVGGMRLLPTSGPTMIRDIWPQSLKSLPMNFSDEAWELSRFAIDIIENDGEDALKQRQQVIGEMFCGLIELCILVGIKEVYALYGSPIERMIKRIDCLPLKTSEKMLIGDIACQTGVFKTDQTLLARVRKATGIEEELLDQIELPAPLVDDNHASQRSIYVG